MDHQFQLTSSMNQNNIQSNILESMIISQNFVSSIQQPIQRQEKKQSSNIFNQNTNILESVQEQLPTSVNKNPTQIVEEEEYSKSIYGIQFPQFSDKNQEEFGEPEIIDTNTFTPKILKCIQLKLKQDQKHQEKMNLPDQIYESEGGEEVKVGRSKQQNDIVISDELSSISSNHAVFYWNNEKQSWYLNDNNSKNGSFLVIDNSPVKSGDKIAIGLFQCTIEYNANFLKNDFTLTFKCMVDDSIEPFTINKSLQYDEKLIIGKNHQKQLKDDPMIANNQCYIQYQKYKMKIWNCEEAEYKIAKILQPSKSVKVKNNDVLRFGLVNYYIFSQFSKKVESKQNQMVKNNSNNDTISSADSEDCCICFLPNKKLCILNPCNHSRICLQCVLRLMESKQICPICQGQFKDFSIKC